MGAGGANLAGFSFRLKSPMAKKKLTRAERMVDEAMLALLEWAADNPTKWNPIGKLESTMKAAELLEARGVIEVWRETGLYRLKPKK
jgi:hypothetical protein